MKFGGINARFTPFPSQLKARREILLALSRHRAALDLSDTGVGKTFHVLMVAVHLGLMPVVITPKVVKPGFQAASSLVDVSCLVANYEHLRTDGNSYVVADEEGVRWLLDPKKHVIIFDEGHRVKNNTITGQIALAAHRQGFHILIATATPFASPLDLEIIGEILGIHSGGRDFMRWAMENGCKMVEVPQRGRRRDDGEGKQMLQFDIHHPNADLIMRRLNSLAVAGRGTRILRSECEDFPETSIRTMLLDLGQNRDVLEAAYAAYTKEIEMLQAKHAEAERREIAIAARCRLKQLAEFHKVPAIASMILEEVEKGNSVVVFLNYIESIQALSEILKHIPHGHITGKHPKRDVVVADFQADKLHLVLCQFQAGGAGVSLHDIKGNRPRTAILVPNDSMLLMKQALGRVWRRGGKTPSRQYILFGGKTIEEVVCRSFIAKFRNQDICLDRKVSFEAANMARDFAQGANVLSDFAVSEHLRRLYWQDDADCADAA